MNQRYRRKKVVAEINITPFTDVILVLLVIFMITTPLLSQSNLKVKLPQASSGQKVSAHPKRRLTITITREGPIYLEKELVNAKGLKEKISQLYSYNPDLSLILHIDKNASFKYVAGVLDIVSGIGISDVNIATVEKE